jgi:hypothetical protein
MKIHAEAFNHLVDVTQRDESDAYKWTQVFQQKSDQTSELVRLQYRNRKGEVLAVIEKDDTPVCPNCSQEVGG